MLHLTSTTFCGYKSPDFLSSQTVRFKIVKTSQPVKVELGVYVRFRTVTAISNIKAMLLMERTTSASYASGAKTVAIHSNDMITYGMTKLKFFTHDNHVI